MATVANDACLQTIPRTINTGLGAMFILLALYFLGGETLTDFALALLIGIAAGTYSSVFTATPLAVALESRTVGRPPLEPAPARPPLEPASARSPATDRELVQATTRTLPSPASSRPGPPRPRKRRPNKKGRRRR